MRCFYSFLVFLFSKILPFAALFNVKARKWVKNRHDWEKYLAKELTKKGSYTWIHCASAGEFEQAVPLIEKIKKYNKERKIAVSFFSPSGYEMYKDSGIADLFFYLPLDTNKNALILIKILNPVCVLFIRNEIWWNLLATLKDNNIPVYLVNANKSQKRNLFYQFYLKQTQPLFTKIFHTDTYGNTKLEKVIANKNSNFKDDILEDFCKNSLVITLGSSWKVEESLISTYYKNHCNKYPNLKIVIAPHEYNEKKHDELIKIFSDWQTPSIIDVIPYTNYSSENNKRILFLDKKSMLKYVYRYTDIAFIGGGFDKTVHNISEAAVYGKPTLFGPNYCKFEEVNDLVHLNTAFPVTNYKELEEKLTALINDNALRNSISVKLNDYFESHQHSAEKIISEILQ